MTNTPATTSLPTRNKEPTGKCIHRIILHAREGDSSLWLVNKSTNHFTLRSYLYQGIAVSSSRNYIIIVSYGVVIRGVRGTIAPILILKIFIDRIDNKQPSLEESPGHPDGVLF